MDLNELCEYVKWINKFRNISDDYGFCFGCFNPVGTIIRALVTRRVVPVALTFNTRNSMYFDV
jgi:hypothetical protein